MSSERIDLVKIQADFPILSRKISEHRLVYLDNAATTQKPQIVIEVVADSMREFNGNVNRGVHTLSQVATKFYDKARANVARFMNASESDTIIFTKGTTESINLVASSWGRANLKPGDEILLSVMEHHSNIIPWQLIGEQTGAKIRVIPMLSNGDLDLAAYAKLLSDKTKIVSVAHISNALGTVHPVKEMIGLAHQAGSVFMVDGAQAAPHTPIDVQDLDADFYAFSGHKIYGPTGIGILYGKRKLLEVMPPYQGGGDMIHTVSFEGSTFADIPRRFEAGTPPISSAIGLGAAIDYVNQIGLDAMAEHEVAMAEEARVRMAEITGLTLQPAGATNAGIISFTMDGIHPHDIGTILDSEGIAVRAGHHCCQPLMQQLGVPATVRASFAVYNSLQDVDALIAGLFRVKEVFA